MLLRKKIVSARRSVHKKRWQMGDDLIKTGVDQLIGYLEGKEKVPLLETAKELGVSVDTLQSWVDFLVEEGILGIEYKFTKPFIYLNRDDKEKAKILGEEELTWEAYHKEFLERAKEKRIPDLKAASLWKNHVLGILEQKKSFFYDEARRLSLEHIDTLWNDYKTNVLIKI